MVKAYRARWRSGAETYRLFYYRDSEQYQRKLRSYASVLSGLGEQIGTILDVGCGTGELLRFYTPAKQYLGVDLVPEFIEAARKRFPQATFRYANVLTETVGTFDTCVLVGALGLTPLPLVLLSRVSALGRAHLVFDYLPVGGSAESVEWLRKLRPKDVSSILSRDAWRIANRIELGGSTVVVHCVKRGSPP
jgi:SAM-dependent methyltransferase